MVFDFFLSSSSVLYRPGTDAYIRCLFESKLSWNGRRYT